MARDRTAGKRFSAAVSYAIRGRGAADIRPCTRVQRRARRGDYPAAGPQVGEVGLDRGPVGEVRAMPAVTFHVLEGIDKGRVFREMPTPVTIGREEGNVLRLNDERVSRFHAKVQSDNGEIILTDLESTTGTRVDGNVVQIRRRRPGALVNL